MAMMTVDPNEKGAQYKREQIAQLINFTEEQKTIVDLYILEEKTKERHWNLDPEDHNVYIEWMNGTTILRNKVNERINMTRAQKISAMNNNSTVQQGNVTNGYSAQSTQPQTQQVQVPRGPAATTTTANVSAPIQQSQQPQQRSSTFQHPPINPTSTGKKRYPRRSR